MRALGTRKGQVDSPGQPGPKKYGACPGRSETTDRPKKFSFLYTIEVLFQQAGSLTWHWGLLARPSLVYHVHQREPQPRAQSWVGCQVLPAGLAPPSVLGLIGWPLPWTHPGQPGLQAQGLSFSDSEGPPPAHPLPGVKTEAQGGTTMYPGVKAAPGPGSGWPSLGRAQSICWVQCHEALSPSSLRGGQPGSGRPRPRPPSTQTAAPGSPRLPEHHPCCLDRPAAQLPAGLFPQTLPWRAPSTLPVPRGQRCPPGATGHMGLCRPLGSQIEAGLDRR